MRKTSFLTHAVFALIVIFLMAGSRAAFALQFTNEFITWRSYIAEYKAYLFRGDDGDLYYFDLPPEWSYQLVSAREARLNPPEELSSVTLLVETANSFPGFEEKEDLKDYAELLVRNLPEETEEFGKVSVVGEWIHYSDWESLALKVPYTLHGNRMLLAMGFCYDPDKDDEQLRWKITCRERDFEKIRQKMHRPWSAWGKISRERADELNNAEVIID